MYIEMFNLSLLHFNKKHTVGMKVNCIFFLIWSTLQVHIEDNLVHFFFHKGNQRTNGETFTCAL